MPDNTLYRHLKRQHHHVTLLPRMLYNGVTVFNLAISPRDAVYADLIALAPGWDAQAQAKFVMLDLL